MGKASFRLPFRLLGIPVRIDGSFLLVLPLFAWLIASQIPSYLQLLRGAGVAIDPDALQGGATPYLVGLSAALGLFACVLVHELGHAVIARLYRVEVKEITLWFLGGLAQFDELPRQRGAEAVVAIAGPITSALLAVLCWGLWRGAEGAGPLFVLSYLTVTNGFLALFNLLPALPLDGGRVLRSLLALRLPHLRATRLAATISRITAVLMGVYGFLSLNIVLLAIAFFVYNAVRVETQQALLTNVFEEKRVDDIMTREVISVEPDMLLSQFRQLMYYRKHTGYPVVDGEGRLVGFARLQDASEDHEGAPRASDATVASIMRPAATIAGDAEALEALRRIAQEEVGRLVVVDAEGRLVGLLSRTDLMRAIQEADPRAGSPPEARPDAPAA